MILLLTRQLEYIILDYFMVMIIVDLIVLLYLHYTTNHLSCMQLHKTLAMKI